MIVISAVSKNSRCRGALFVFAAFFAIVLTAVLFRIFAVPIFQSAAKVKLSILADEVMNEAAQDLFPVLSEGLFSVKYSDDGTVTSVSLNPEKQNELRIAYLNAITTSLANRNKTELSVPVGSLTGSVLLSGRGFSIKVIIVPCGSARAAFESTLSSAGINRTRYSVSLRVTLSVYTLSPFSCSTEREMLIPVSETVTSGSVPLLYSQ